MDTFDASTEVRVFDSRETRLPTLPVVAAAGSLVAAAAHAWVVRSHTSHWWGYGAFFACLAATQAVYALAVLRRPTRTLATVGIFGTVAVLALYVWSRTIGVPLGPHAGRPETVGLVDLAAAAAEALVVVALARLRRGEARAPRPTAGRPAVAAGMVILIAAGLSGPAGHAHPQPSQIRLADGPETWVGPVPTPTLEPETPVTPDGSPEPAPGQQQEPEWTCIPELAAGIEPPAPASPGRARAVLATYEGAVHMYTPWNDIEQSLTEKNDNCWPGGASFRDPAYVTFHAEQTVYGLDLSDGSLEVIVTSKHGIAASAWSPDGGRLAYLTYGSGEDGGPQLVLLDPEDGSKDVLRTFASGGGRCGGEDDETTLAWASDGHALIVVATFLDFSGETMFVVDGNGDDLVPPRLGTHARWAPDAKRIYYRDFSDDRKWYALNSTTNDRGTLGAMKPGTHGLAVSPDGTMLAYADGEDDVGVYVYDVAKKQQRRVAEDAVEAVWIGPQTILVTDTKACGNECLHSAWTAAGTVSVVDVVMEEKRDTSLGSTIAAAVWLEPPAPPTPGPSPSPSPSSPSPSPSPSETGVPLPTPPATSSPEPSAEPTPSPTETPS